MGTMIGALILLLLTATLIVALFAGFTAPEVLTNASLIILGYFLDNPSAVNALSRATSNLC